MGPLIGNGPFSALLMSDEFAKAIDVDDPIEVGADFVSVGQLKFDATKAKDWNSGVNWGKIRLKKDKLLVSCELIQELIERYAPPQSFAELVLPIPQNFEDSDPIFTNAKGAISELFKGLIKENIMAMRNSSKLLAGLGIGLTPAGDDFLVGVMLALFALGPSKKAEELSAILAKEAAPLTNSISSEWLKASAKGEAGESWHNLVKAIAENHGEQLAEAVMRILPSGHTSGADALGAFVATIRLLSSEGKIL